MVVTTPSSTSSATSRVCLEVVHSLLLHIPPHFCLSCDTSCEVSWLELKTVQVSSITRELPFPSPSSTSLSLVSSMYTLPAPPSTPGRSEPPKSASVMGEMGAEAIKTGQVSISRVAEQFDLVPQEGEHRPGLLTLLHRLNRNYIQALVKSGEEALVKSARGTEEPKPDEAEQSSAPPSLAVEAEKLRERLKSRN